MEKQEELLVPVPVDQEGEDDSASDPEVIVNEETEPEEEVRIGEIVPKEQLIKIIECPVCLEIPFPPIFNCEKGHIMCSSCRPRVQNCAVCRCRFRGGGSRNYPLEDIILGSSFPCKYKDLGCKDFILGRTFSDHLKICQYNPVFVLCNLNRGTSCQNVRIPCSHYLEHLKGQHNCTTGGQRNQGAYRFVQIDDSTHMGQMISTDYFEQNGEAFLQKWEFENNLYYTWVCMLNSTEKSREVLEVMISVSCAVSVNKANFSATLALQEASLPLKDVKASGQFLALHPTQLLCFDGYGGVIDIQGQSWELHWNSAVQIRQKIPKRVITYSHSHIDEDDWLDETWE